MQSASPAIKTNTVYRKDHKPSAFLASAVALKVDVQSLEDVHVTNTTHFARNFEKGAPQTSDLVLNGPKPSKDPFTTLEEISLNGAPLPKERYSIDPETGDLTIKNVPNQPFSIEVHTKINPTKNKSGSGLYTSDGMLCTQCEAQGFRNITYALDRPDVFSAYSVIMEANKKQFPQLLCNGVPNVEMDVGDDRHRVVWQDLRPKPSYLFAMAALDGDLIKDTFTYPDDQKVDLRYYVNKGKGEQAKFAMQCLKDSMQHEYEAWGHKYHGIQYQGNKSLFMTLAVSGLNMGAMENNGLNIFNDQLVLSNKDNATDARRMRIDGVVNHEFDHDETGNWRIPANWFQLAYKEGLTVFRDQTYGAFKYGETYKRIQDVIDLRSRVFLEDDGPKTHPIVVEKYDAVDNLYDGLTYPKAAHINRMLQTLVGKDVYREAYKQFHNTKSEDYYHRSPESCTIQEYFKHIATVSGKDLTQFIDSWTSQSGVPVLEFDGVYDADNRTYSVTITQRLKEGQKPYHIPFKMGLLDRITGENLVLQSGDKDTVIPYNGVFEITKPSQTFVFHSDNQPIMSLNRDFEAYAKTTYTDRCKPSVDDLALMVKHEKNDFKRWDAMQELSMSVIQSMLDAKREGKPLPPIPQALFSAYKHVLADETLTPVLKAEILKLPNESYIANMQRKGSVDPRAIHEVHGLIQTALGKAMTQEFRAVYDAMQSDKPYEFNKEAIGQRALKNECLGFLVSTQQQEYADLAFEQFKQQVDLSNKQANYNDASAAIAALLQQDEFIQKPMLALEQLERTHRHDHLVMNDWLRFQASAPYTQIYMFDKLMHSDHYDPTNANKVRALLGGFIGNVKKFHAVGFHHEPTCDGYQFIANQITQIDAYNPQLAARITGMAFEALDTFVPGRQALMREALGSIVKARGSELSANVGGTIKQILEGDRPTKTVADVTVAPQLPRYRGSGGMATAG